MPPDTPREVEIANARLAQISATTPIHGALRSSPSTEKFPLILAGVHCTACELQVGGALDLSGDVGPTDGEGAVRSLIDSLSDRGCVHARALVAELERGS